MAKTELNLDATLSLAESARLIAACGHKKSYLLAGEPGIGKSSILKMLKAMPQFANHRFVYMDMTQMDIGDIQVPWLDQVTQTVSFFPNEALGATQHGSTPVVLMLDEFGKANRAVQNVVLPVLLERRAGRHMMHPDSVVFATTNLASDGVGDSVQAHAGNRFSHITVGKPSADEWVAWGLENGIHEAVLVAVRENPHWLLSYTDEGQKDNPYIFQPKSPARSFVTPRSLEFASHTMHAKTRGDFGHGEIAEKTVFADLAGTIGKRAAADMRAQVELMDELPQFSQVLADPKNAQLPKGAAAKTLMIFSLLARVDQATFNPVFTYVSRMDDELQGLFTIQLTKIASKVQYLSSNALFTSWVAKYAKYLG